MTGPNSDLLLAAALALFLALAGVTVLFCL